MSDMPRCWSDLSADQVEGGTAGRIFNPLGCWALGTDRLGLCPKHASEILGPQKEKQWQ